MDISERNQNDTLSGEIDLAKGNRTKIFRKGSRGAKMRAATELDNLLATARDKRHKPDDGHHPEATGGWDYYTTNFVVEFKDANGDPIQKEFVGTVKVMNTEQGRRFHDITEIEEVTNNTRGVSEINSSPAIAATSPTTSTIPQTPYGVNIVQNRGGTSDIIAFEYW
ncbi:MAG: hypothetical protein E7409_07530 [Ruminococcaceae bacterium]|nr:hypothetical protein [Oscillospiraceae bacterium]